MRHLAFSVRWSGSEPGAGGELGALALDRAQSAAALRASLAQWKLPVVDVIYAAVDGAAGRQTAGLLPDRIGWDGALPAPGWTGAFEWRGWRRPDELPHAVVPAAGGFVVSANQNAARSNRLNELLDGTHAETVDDFKRFQLDTTAWNAAQLVPLLAPLSADRNEVEKARGVLLKWDRRIAADSSAAALYVFWEEAMLRKLAESRLAPDLRGDYAARAAVPMTALTRPSRVWFDGDPLQARDRLLIDALAAAVDRLSAAAQRGRDVGQPAHADLQAPARDIAGGQTSIQRRPVRAPRLCRHRHVVVSVRRGDRRRVVQADCGSRELGPLRLDERAGAVGVARQPRTSPISPNPGRPANISRWPSRMKL